MWTPRSLPPAVAPRRHVGWCLEPWPSQIQHSNFKRRRPPLTSLQCSPWNQRVHTAERPHVPQQAGPLPGYTDKAGCQGGEGASCGPTPKLWGP